jgi:Tol biopolymer transport system component
VVSAGSPQIYLLPLSPDYRPAGEARRLDLPQVWAESPAWTSDGQQIVYSASQPWGAGDTKLWRIPVSGSEKPEPLMSVGENGSQPTISRQGNRLVYADWRYDTDVWRAELSGAGKASPVKLITSTRAEFESQYSPDGSHITFVSDRSGHREIWACNSDGSTPVQLTSLEGAAGAPYWFPDGRRIVFDLNKDGQWDIYQIDTDSRVSRRLTNDHHDDNTPSVSHDGKWIYFSSRRTGSAEIWRMPADGGEATQLTHNRGFIPIESAEGQVVYYEKTLVDPSEVWQVPVTGGNETRVLGPVAAFGFAVVANGIYFIEIGTSVVGGSRDNSLKVYKFATGKTERVADVKLTPQTGLSISPDGRYALMTLVDPEVCDLKLVETFR